MKLHELKIKHEYLIEVATGKKTFELRKNDRDYKVGDLIRFIEVEEKEKLGALEELGKSFKQLAAKLEHNIDTNDLYKITYILKDVPQYGLDQKYCILGIKKLKVIEE